MLDYEPIFRALNQHGARYVVVGGVAVVLHGHTRLTVDLDLCVDLSPTEASKAIDALTSLGFRPTVPVDPRAIADEATRDSWIRDKGMRVFSMRHPDDPFHEVDVFVEQPVPFEDLWGRSQVMNLAGVDVRVASIPDLIQMKREAGRPQDLRTLRHSNKSKGMEMRLEPTQPDLSDAEARRKDFDRHRREQLIRRLHSTPAQRLRCLEEMIEFARRAGALPRRPAS